MTITGWFELAVAIARVTGHIAAVVLVVLAARAWYKDDKQSATLLAVWAILLGGGQ